jgi:UDP:flavonoid glycosyltransferase YjiC (YdhE family)
MEGFEVIVASTESARKRVEEAGPAFLSLGMGETEDEYRRRGRAMGKASSSLKASMEVIINLSFGRVWKSIVHNHDVIGQRSHPSHSLVFHLQSKEGA